MFTYMENYVDELAPELLQPHHEWEFVTIKLKAGYFFNGKPMMIAKILKTLPEEKQRPFFYLNFLNRWGKIYHTLNQYPFANDKQAMHMQIKYEKVRYIPVKDDPYGLDNLRKDLYAEKIYYVTNHDGIFVQDTSPVVDYTISLIKENNYGTPN